MKNIYRIAMTFMMTIATVIGFTSCGGSDDSDEAANDTSKLIVTGGVGDYQFYCGEESCSFSYWLSGYVNLTPEMKLLPSSTYKYGIEVRQNGSYVGRYNATKVESNNGFWIQINNLKDNTTYTYIAFLNYGTSTEYGVERSFKTPSAESEIAKLSAKTGQIAAVYNNEVFITNSEFRVACSKNKSKLTASNIKTTHNTGTKKTYTNNDLEPLYSYEAPKDFSFARNIIVRSSNDISVYSETNNSSINSDIIIWGLTNATTYYYCGYKMTMGNVIMGEIKSFKTK